MIDKQEFQLLAQLVDSISDASAKLETAYNQNNSKNFENAKGAILDFQEKISLILK